MTENALQTRPPCLTGSILGGDTWHMRSSNSVGVACWWRAPLKEWALVV